MCSDELRREFGRPCWSLGSSWRCPPQTCLSRASVTSGRSQTAPSAWAPCRWTPYSPPPRRSPAMTHTHTFTHMLLVVWIVAFSHFTPAHTRTHNICTFIFLFHVKIDQCRPLVAFLVWFRAITEHKRFCCCSWGEGSEGIFSASMGWEVKCKWGLLNSACLCLSAVTFCYACQSCCWGSHAMFNTL